MTTKMIERSVKLTKTPTDGSGKFTGVIYPFEVDKDNERFGEVVDLPDTFPARYQHAMGDPEGDIGEVKVTKVGKSLELDGQLNLDNPLAVLVYERMLLAPDDPRAMHEFSVGFLYNPTATYKGEKGETVIPKVKIYEVSIVVAGAQRTQLLSIKAAKEEARNRYSLKEVESDILASDAVLLGIVSDPKTLGQKSPPWHVEKQGDEFCVVANETGETVKCHATREDANAHMRALYANTPDASKDSKYLGAGTLSGSWEAAEEAVQKELQSWVDANYPPDNEQDRSWVYRVGTYPGRVVFGVERIDEETAYFEATYQIDNDGNVVLGTPTEVSVETTVTPSGTEGKNMSVAEMTVDEFRASLGLEPREHGGDEVIVPLNVEVKALSADDVDFGAWDGGAALAKGKSAADFRKFAFERDNDSDPDTPAHWALPYKDGPDAKVNAKGVAAAVGALNGARGGKPDLKNESAARSKLESLSSQIEKLQEGKSEVKMGTGFIDIVPRFADQDGNEIDLSAFLAGKVGRAISSKSADSLKAKLSAAVDAFVAEVNGSSEDASGSETKIETDSDTKSESKSESESDQDPDPESEPETKSEEDDKDAEIRRRLLAL